MRFLFLFAFFSNFINSLYIGNNNQNIELNNFTFGSCFYGRLSKRLDIFEAIIEYDPQLWLWTGDAAYLDPFEHTLFYYWKSSLIVNFTHAEEIFKESKNEPCK